MIGIGGTLLEGVSFASAMYVGSSGVGEVSEIRVVEAEESVRQMNYILYIDGVPRAFASVQRVPPPTYNYDLSGNVTPVGSTVYLATSPAEFTEENLRANIVQTTVSSAEDGSFAFDNIPTALGEVVIWLTIDDVTLAGYANAKIMHVKVTAHGTGAAIQTVQIEVAPQTYSQTCPDCGGSGSMFVPQEYTETCEICGGSGQVEGGDGTETCSHCGGSGSITDIRGVEIPCDRCNGTGTYTHTDSTEGTNASLTLGGAAPAGCEKVLLSRGHYDTEQELLDNIITEGAVNSERAWEIHVTTGWGDHTVWCYGSTPGLTVTKNIASPAAVCLAGNTPISLPDGTTRRMDELQKGDTVLAGDGTPTVVVAVARGHFQPGHTLYTFEDGTVVDEIHDHRFYNVERGFWQYLPRWRIGEHARRIDGVEVALVSVERIEERAEMFGLWTESHDYWACGLLSGETAANQRLLADATAEQAADMAASMEEQAVLRLFGWGGLMP